MEQQLLAAEPQEAQSEYYAAVFEAFKRYVRDGNRLALVSTRESRYTTVSLVFDTDELAPYMAHL